MSQTHDLTGCLCLHRLPLQVKPDDMDRGGEVVLSVLNNATKRALGRVLLPMNSLQPGKQYIAMDTVLTAVTDCLFTCTDMHSTA